MSLGYGSIYTLLADLRDRYGFSEAQLGVIVAAGFLVPGLLATNNPSAVPICSNVALAIVRAS